MFSIILAAGKGTRMGPTDRPKVCLLLDGVPVIVHAIETYSRCGIEHHIVVVGDRAEQVAAAVCERFPDTIFVYQPSLRGSGDAARRGAAVLDAFGYTGDVLVVAGDKVLEEHAVRALLDLFRRTAADLCLLVGAKDDFPSSGRIVEDETGQVLGNIEVSDIARARLIGHWFERTRIEPLDRDRLRAELLEAFSTERKAQRAMPQFWRLLGERSTITNDDLSACFSRDEAFFEFRDPNGRVHRLTADEIESHVRYVNLSVFCFRTEALRYALERLGNNNAQGEEYLTDTVCILANARKPDGWPLFRVVLYPIQQPTDAMAFNTPEELNAIRDYYHGQKPQIRGACG